MADRGSGDGMAMLVPMAVGVEIEAAMLALPIGGECRLDDKGNR